MATKLVRRGGELVPIEVSDSASPATAKVSSGLTPKATLAGPPPAKVSPPATAAATQPPAADRYQQDLSQANDIAKGMLAGNQSAQITDPHAQENQQYLDLLKSRLGGLDSKEMLAAKEQELSDLDHQTAQNLERYASIAGSSGVDGGARAALLGRALQQDNEGHAALQRQLITDNIAAKDRAAQVYGGALSSATNTGLDINKYNAGAKDRDTGLALSLPFDIQSGIGGYRAQDAADKANAEQTQLAKEALKNLAPKAPAATTVAATNANTKFDEKYGASPVGSATLAVSRNGQQIDGESAKEMPSVRYQLERGLDPFNLTPDQRAKLNKDPGFQEAQKKDAALGYSYGLPPKATIVCTESHRQGLISDSEYRLTKAYGSRKLSASQYAAYISWATPIVALMRKNGAFSRVVGAFVRVQIGAMRAELAGDKSPLIGKLALSVFKAMNFLFEKKAAWQTQNTIS